MSDQRAAQAAAPSETATTIMGCRTAHHTFSTVAARTGPWGRNAKHQDHQRNTTISRHCACHRSTSDSSTPEHEAAEHAAARVVQAADDRAREALERDRKTHEQRRRAIGASRKPHRPASAELSTKAPTITAVTLMPIRLATLPFVRDRAHGLADHGPAHHPVEADHDHDGDTEHQHLLRPHADAGDSDHLVAHRRRHDHGAVPRSARPMLCRMTPKPRVLITQAMPGWPANGRTARTVEQPAEQTHDAQRGRAAASNCCQPGQRPPTSGELIGLPSSRNRALMPMNAPDRDELAVREVQRLRRREGDAEAKRDQRVGAADGQATDNRLQERVNMVPP